MGYKEMYEEWLNNPYFDDATKAELKAIEGNEKEIEDRFYMDLEFGTAGLRGVIGAGTNRMNVYTVRKATQGLANYINNVHAQEKGVAIAYDSRHMSPEFADVAALCLAANGIKAYVFESLRPTPELSYAVRRLGCTAGINITASHNPPEYNGYKVYWEDGAQITPPHDTGIMAEVKKVTDYAAVKTMDKAAAVAAGLYQVIGADIDDPYIEELKKLAVAKRPIFGICLGHQLLAIARGAKTGKMKYGHRGANQPVKDLETGRIYISSQNHGYEVLRESLPAGAEETFINVNDGTCEGITYRDIPAFTVQFHPEACAGPKDTEELFGRFIKMMEKYKEEASCR